MLHSENRPLYFEGTRIDDQEYQLLVEKNKQRS